MHAERCDEKDPYARFGERLERDAIDQRPHRYDEQQRQERVCHDTEFQRCDEFGERDQKQRHDQGGGDHFGETHQIHFAPMPDDAGDRGKKSERNEEPESRRHAARFESGNRQSRKRDEFALRYEDHARDGKHKHERDRNERINRAVDHRILDEEQNDRRIQDDQAPRACVNAGSERTSPNPTSPRYLRRSYRGVTSTGKLASERSVLLSLRFGSPTISMRLTRSASAPSIISASSRATIWPTQTWMPLPSATWPVGRRLMSNFSGSSQRRGSRFAEARKSSTFSSWGISMPSISTGRIVVRKKVCTGDSHLSTSSKATLTSDLSSMSACH